jgi:hypothetical protein
MGKIAKRRGRGVDFDCADFSYSLNGLIKLHKRAFRHFASSGVGALNLGEPASGSAALRRKIYNNFFAERSYDIFIDVYDKPSSIALAVNKVFYDFAKSDDVYRKLARLAIKLFEANCFFYGNREVIYGVLERAVAENRVGFGLSFNMFSTILLRDDMDSDELKLAESQLTLALKMLTKEKTDEFEKIR